MAIPVRRTLRRSGRALIHIMPAVIASMILLALVGGAVGGVLSL